MSLTPYLCFAFGCSIVACASPRVPDTLPSRPASPTASSGPNVALAPPASTSTLRYLACGEPGHALLEVGPQFGAHLVASGLQLGQQVTIDGSAWSLGESHA